MNIPDVLKNCTADLFIERMSHKRAKKDDDDGLALFDWTIDFILDLSDEVVDKEPKYLKGSKLKISEAKAERGSGRVDHIPLDGSRAVRLNIARSGSDVVKDVAAEVRLIEVIATEGSSRFRAKIKLFGLYSPESGDLLCCDQRTVSLEVTPVQAALPLEEAA